MDTHNSDTSHTTHTAPKDIACVSIDTSASCAERIKQYVEQVGDPYCYTDSGIVVKLAYSNTDISLQDRLAGLCVQPVLSLQSFPVDKSKAGKHNRPVSENNVATRQ